MRAVMRQYLSAGVLTTWGAVLTWFFVSGRVASYLHPAFHVWTIASGITLLLMAAALIFLPQGPAGNSDILHSGDDHEGHDHGHDHEHTADCAPGHVHSDSCGHEHEHEHEGCCGHDPSDTTGPHRHATCCGHPHGDPGVGVIPALILIVPLLTAATVSPSQFGAAAVANRGYVQSINDLPGYQPFVEPALPTEDGSPGPTEVTPSSDYLPRNAAGQITAQTVDLLYAAEEPAMREDFDGKEVEMIGQFMPAKENNAKGNRFSLVRMFVMCCAADARPVAVSVEANGASAPEMSWVKVVGKATFPLEGGRRIPVVQAESVTPCDPPPESFIY